MDEHAETIVLLLDELPEVLHSLNKSGKAEEAKAILKQLRTWRQGRFQKVAICLGRFDWHSLRSEDHQEGRTSDLNDLKKINCEPLTKAEAMAYIDWASASASIAYDDSIKTYFLQKIQHFYTPYFINLMLAEIDALGRKDDNTKVTTQVIDQAFNKVVKNNEHFADWKNRLSDYLPKSEYEFVNEILIHLAHQDFVDYPIHI